MTKDSKICKILAVCGTQEDTLKKMLFYEQTNTCNTAFILTPVEVETTQLGMNFAALKSVISQGLYCLDPYNYVSFRVLH